MAGGSDNSRGGIPAWQRKENRPEAADSPQSSTNPAATPETAPQTDASDLPASKPPTTVEKPSATDSAPSQADLTMKALRFLQDESIRDAPAADKLAFLESKGLDEDSLKSVRALLSTPAALQERKTAVASGNPQSPPIITYPEFMMHSTKPPPLITTERLLNTAYAATGAAALVYGLSEYLVKPMVESLTSARHDLASGAKSKLDEFNEKLAGIVSQDPAQKLPMTLPQLSAISDSESSDSDPTELFHRDFGTQTSPDLEHRNKDGYSDSSSDDSDDRDAATAQAESLQRMRALATDLSSSNLAAEGQACEEISTVIRVLNEYLESISYQSNSYGVYGSVFEANGPDGKKKDDELNKVKAEIRGIKGQFLSARNFPSSGIGSVGRSIN